MKEEYKHPRTRLADVVPLPAPFSVYVDPCGCCNFKCRFCPTNNSEYNVEERHKMMHLTVFEKITNDLSLFEEQVKVINLFGFGEPLLNPCVPYMVDTLKKLELCREVRLYTNGSLLTPVLNERLITSGIDMIRISVEALSSEGYKDICGITLDYNVFISNIKDLYIRSRGTNTKISAKIISSTLTTNQDLEMFTDIFAPISDHHFVEAEENYWIGYNAKNSGLLLPGAITKTVDYTDGNCSSICSYPLTDLMIFSNGKVGVCCADWRMDTVLGDVLNETLQDIWTGNKLYEFRMKQISGQRKELPSCCACKRISPDSIDNDAKIILCKLQDFTYPQSI